LIMGREGRESIASLVAFEVAFIDEGALSVGLEELDAEVLFASPGITPGLSAANTLAGKLLGGLLGPAPAPGSSTRVVVDGLEIVTNPFRADAAPPLPALAPEADALDSLLPVVPVEPLFTRIGAPIRLLTSSLSFLNSSSRSLSFSLSFP
jgi:hypothetical protein